MSNETPLVGIILGSKSDLPAMEGCTEMLEKFCVPYELVVHSAHRNPEQVAAWAKSAEERGLKVIIGAAGKAAALAGVVAAHTPLPVVAVPMKTSDLGGMDSLLSTVQMPTGIPVATVAVGGGDNAAYLAAQILSIKYPELADRLDAHRREMAEAIEADDHAIAQTL